VTDDALSLIMKAYPLSGVGFLFFFLLLQSIHSMWGVPMKTASMKLWPLFMWCVLFLLVIPAHYAMAASATITAVDQGNGGVKLTATGSFSTCTYCDANGNNCSSTNSGSISIPGYCGASGSGSATCSTILDRGSLHGSHTFTATASDCKGSASGSTTLVLDNTPSVSITSPSGTLSGPFDITGTATFKPTLSTTKGTIYAYINGGYVGGKNCTTESCSYSYKEVSGSLYDMSHGGPYTVKLVASGGGASATANGTFSVDKTPTVSISSPSGTVSGPFDITGTATFKPTLSTSKGTIYAYINGGNIGGKNCTTETCSFSYLEINNGNLYTLSPGGPYTIKLTASGGGVTATDTKTFTVVDPVRSTGPTCNTKEVGSSANLKSGNLYHDQPVLKFGNQSFEIAYNSLDTDTTPLGKGWTHSYNLAIATATYGLKLKTSTGDLIPFTLSGSNYIPAPQSGDTSVIVKNSDNSYTRTLKSGDIQTFNSAGKLISITDLRGNITTLAYDTSNNLTTVTDINGRVLTFTSSSGKITAIKDPAGNSHTFTYSGNFLAKVSDPLGYSWLYENDGYRLNKKTDPNGNATSYTYDTSGKLAKSTDPNGKEKTISYTSNTTSTFTEKDGGVWTQQYDISLNLPTSKTDPNGNTTSYTYDGNGNMLSVTKPDGAVTRYTYDSAGNMTSTTDPLGKTTTYTHNNLGQVLTTTDANNRTTTNSYDTNGNLLQTIDPKGAKTVYTYDSKGNLLTRTDPLGSITTYTYDSANNLVTAKDTSGGITSFTYDINGNLLTQKDPSGNITTYTYDAMNRPTTITDPLGNITQYTHDKNGNRVTVTDANGMVTTTVYNYKNQPLTIKDAQGNITTMAYSGSGCGSCGGGGADKLVSVTDASSNTTSYEYDLTGKLVRETDPRGNTTSYSYNSNGTMASRTDGNGHTTNYIYNAAGRLLSRTYSDGTSDTFTYDAAGNLITASNATISYTLGYDANNRLTSTTDNLGRTISYTLDANGNRTKMTAPDGRITTYAYDAKNRLTQLTDNGNAYVFTYDALDRRTKLLNPNGTYTTYSYDTDSRITALVTQTSAGAIINSISHDYDKTANRTTNVEPAGTTAYNYDPVYRLLKSSLGTTTKELFTYDATGNRTSGPQASTTYTIDQGNQLAASPNVTFAYDNNGNITGKTTLSGTYSYIYDDENRLTEVRFNGTAIATYKYDPFGRRIEKNVASPATTYKYLYDSANILYEYDASNAIKTRYTHNLATDDPLAIEAYGTLYTYHKDTLGSVRAITDSTQATINTYRYDSFGNTTQAGTLLQPYAYTGREWDWETGLYYYRARYYDSRIGRFIQKDPISFAGGDVNLYGYVQNNPMNLADPTGLLVGADDAVVFGAGMTIGAAILASPPAQAIIKKAANAIEKICKEAEKDR